MNPVTALVFYACGDPACPGSGAPRQLRELLSSGAPLHQPASACVFCGAAAGRLHGTVELEAADVGREQVQAYLASPGAHLGSLGAARAALGV